MKVFKTAKSFLLVAILGICAIGLLAIPLIPTNDSGIEYYTVSLVAILSAALLFWILLDTGYVVSETKLLYKSGPFRGKIGIESIRKIQYDNSFFKGQSLKPSLSSTGLIVFYNKFDEIYISPKDREGFILEIVDRNPNIEII